MIATRDIGDCSVPVKAGCAAVIAFAGGQVLGGGAAISDQRDQDTVMQLRDCWAVSDLLQRHWNEVPGIQTQSVPRELHDAIRSTLERFHADGERRITAADERRKGVLDAMQALGGMLVMAGQQAGQQGAVNRRSGGG